MSDEKTNKANLIERLLANRHLTRREFIGHAAALGITATIASNYPSKISMAATPKRGGRFRVGLPHGSTTDSLDPEQSGTHGFLTMLFFTMHSYLAETIPGGHVKPSIAESWEASSDVKTWRIKLKRGIEFQNGKTVTAKDVLASINIHKSPDTKSSAKVILGVIEEIIVDDIDSLVFHLKEGYADLPYILSDLRLAILPANGKGVDWQSGIGAGGYILKDFEPGVSAYLERNPNFFKSDRAHFDEIELLTIADSVARTNALTSERVDAIDGVDLKTLDHLKQRKNVIVEEYPGGTHNTFPMRTDIAPFDDTNIRLALKYAADREAMVKLVLGGHGSVGNDHPIASYYRFFAKELEQREYDPEKAKFYLKKAGRSELKVNLHVAEAGFQGAVDSATLYNEKAAKAGISINVVRVPDDGYWANVWRKKPWCACYWAAWPTEDLMFSQGYAAGAAWNDTFWNHKRFNQLLQAARSELDTNKRREMYIEMQHILRDEGGVVVPMFVNTIHAISPKIAHGEVEKKWGLDSRRACERWWFKS